MGKLQVCKTLCRAFWPSAAARKARDVSSHALTDLPQEGESALALSPDMPNKVRTSIRLQTLLNISEAASVMAGSRLSPPSTVSESC